LTIISRVNTWSIPWSGNRNENHFGYLRVKGTGFILCRRIDLAYVVRLNTGNGDGVIGAAIPWRKLWKDGTAKTAGMPVGFGD
jgi:hypothetical protein